MVLNKSPSFSFLNKQNYVRLITVLSSSSSPPRSISRPTITNHAYTASVTVPAEQCVAREIKQRNASAGRSTKTHCIHDHAHTTVTGRGDPPLTFSLEHALCTPWWLSSDIFIIISSP